MKSKLTALLLLALSSGIASADVDTGSSNKNSSISGYAIISVGDKSFSTSLSSGKAYSLKKIDKVGNIGLEIDSQCGAGVHSDFVCRFDIDETSLDSSSNKGGAATLDLRRESFLMAIPSNQAETEFSTHFGDKPVKITVHNIVAY
jgi:hypothetical protein